MGRKRSTLRISSWLLPAILGWGLLSQPFSVVCYAAGAAMPLQELVDQTESGGTVVIPAGQYRGPLVVRKPVTLKAEGAVTVDNPEQGAIISIEADGASVTGLTLADRRNDPDSVAVSITGSGNRLARISITTMGYGVRLNKARRNTLEELDIQGLTSPEKTGAQEAEPSERGNGIDLLESDGNVIAHNRITNMFDGVYIEKGDGNQVEANTVTHSRYGYHLMFSKNTSITGNTGSRNVTGAMIMSDEGSRVTGNDFAKQSANATAQGILLFDVRNALVENNRVEGNRLGIYTQGIRDSQIKSNQFLRNFLGIQMTDAEGNRLEGNEFIANVIQAQAVAGKNNRIAFNYWDDQNSLDLQGDGVSDLPYRANPFFLSLTEKTPAYQLFFGSPGMLLLEGLFQGQSDEAMTDAAPLMKPGKGEKTDGSKGIQAQPLAAGAILLIISLTIFRTGGRKK